MFHSKNICPPFSSLLQGKQLPFTPSPLCLNIFRLFVILSLTRLYHYTPEIFLFSTATFKYKYWGPLRRIGQAYSVKVAFSIFQSIKRVSEKITNKPKILRRSGEGVKGRCSGADPGFQVRGGALKEIAPSGGRLENFWGISCEKLRFYAKKSYFSQF